MLVACVCSVSLWRFINGHWWQSTLTPLSLDTLQRSQHVLAGFRCRSSGETICELSGSIMCPPKSTARGKPLLGFFRSLSLEMKTSVLEQTLWVTEGCTMPLMTTFALHGCEWKGTPVLYKKINQSKQTIFWFVSNCQSWTRIFLTCQCFRVIMIVVNRLKCVCEVQHQSWLWFFFISLLWFCASHIFLPQFICC